MSFLILPFNSSLVRYRLAYHPLAAKDEGTDTPSLSLFSTFNTIRRNEGWSSLYRGLVPLFISYFLLANLVNLQLPIWIITPSPISSHRTYLLPTFLSNTLYILTLTYIYRAISTPHSIHLGQTYIPYEPLSKLYTSYERSGFSQWPCSWPLQTGRGLGLQLPRGWWKVPIKFSFKVLLTPGLLPAMLLHLILSMLVLRPLREKLEPAPAPWPTTEEEWAIMILWTIVPWVLLGAATLLLAPLDVVLTRLLVQRNYKLTPLVERVTKLWERLSERNKIQLVAMGVVNLVGFVWWHAWYTSRDPVHNRRALWVQLGIVVMDVLFGLYFYFWVVKVAEGDGVSGEVEESEPVPKSDEVTKAEEEEEEEAKKSLNLPSPLPEPVLQATQTVQPTGIIPYRPETLPPYTGLYDCVQKIIKEEGWKTLYRGWWVTLLGLWAVPT